MRLVDKLWWFRYSSAVISAVICTYLTIMGFLQGWLYITLMSAFPIAIAIYVLTYFIARHVWRINPEQLPKKRDLALQGVFAYFIAWFTFWIFFFTLAIYFMAGALGVDPAILVQEFKEALLASSPIS